MQNKQLRKWIPFLLFTGLLVGGPSLSGSPALAADPAPQAAPQNANAFTGKITGKSFSGTGAQPSVGQLTIGIGSPQYRCLLNTQSRSL